MKYGLGKIRITIEYCTGCRWLTRASWVAQELLITFESDIEGVILKPSLVSGTFKVFSDTEIFWDRKTEGGFPGVEGSEARFVTLFLLKKI